MELAIDDTISVGQYCLKWQIAGTALRLHYHDSTTSFAPVYTSPDCPAHVKAVKWAPVVFWLALLAFHSSCLDTYDLAVLGQRHDIVLAPRLTMCNPEDLDIAPASTGLLDSFNDVIILAFNIP